MLDEQRESWAEGKERRATTLYFTLFSPCMALSLSFPLSSIFAVFCKVWKCIFSGSGSLQHFSISREEKGERYWKDIIQGPEIPFLRLFCGTFQNKHALVSCSLCVFIVPFLHLALFLPFSPDSFLTSTLVFSGAYFISPFLFYSISQRATWWDLLNTGLYRRYWCPKPLWQLLLAIKPAWCQGLGQAFLM